MSESLGESGGRAGRLTTRRRAAGGPGASAGAVLASALAALSLCCLCATDVSARKKPRPPAGGRAAVVVDERLAVLRDAPGWSANLVRRLGRGRLVAVTGARASADGVSFYRVVVTRRTAGWVQADALVVPGRAGEDERLLRLVLASDDFERAARARIFLDAFPRSAHRAAVLLLLGEAAEAAAPRLTREARRRFDEPDAAAAGAPLRSFFLNYGGLDRWRRQGVVFLFDEDSKQFRYDGRAWREILRRHARGPAAAAARRRLEAGPAGAKVK